MQKQKITNKSNKIISGFTLVELIVVIVILAILATIAFLAFNSYSSSSRDSVRLADVNNVNKSLELYNVNSAKYPDPTSIYMTVVYSGGAIFEQGRLGDSVITAIQKISKKPIDPLNSKEYIYSVNMNNTAYQLKADMENKQTTGFNGIGSYEGEIMSGNEYNSLSVILNSIQNLLNNDYINFDTTFADGTGSICYIKGNFNGLIERTNTGNTNYLLAVPGLILSDSGSGLGNTNIEYNTLTGKVLCNGFNYPCNITYTPTVVYVGNGNSLPSSTGDVGSIIGNLKSAYSGSNALTSSSVISNLLSSTGTNMLSLGVNLVSKVGVVNTSAISTSSTYPGCDTADIVLDNGQVWAACNVGATIAYTGFSIPTGNCGASGYSTDCNTSIRNILGNYYQWGRNDNVTSTSTTTTLATAGTLASGVGHNNFINNTSSPYDWINTQNNNLWGGAGTTATGGTYITQGKPSAMQGPCTNGYHVPTIYEWQQALLSVNPELTYSSSWQNSSIANILKLPLVGNRYAQDGKYYYQGGPTNYFSSSIIGTNAKDILINGTQVQTDHYAYRAYGYAIRCIKN